MRILLGSKNPVKLEAVKEVFSLFPQFKEAQISPVEAPSGVSRQPLGLEETLKGARNRALNSFINCDLSVGIESGLFQAPYVQTGYLNLTSCVIYNGKDFAYGLGPAFELPQEAVTLIIQKGLEVDEAVLQSGLTQNPRIGYHEGIIGILTQAKMTRKEYTKPAVLMAMTRLLQEYDGKRFI